MALTEGKTHNTASLLSIPPEVRRHIFRLLFPCIASKEDYSNPILTRRLAPVNHPRYLCYRCSGEILTQVCSQLRAESLRLCYSAHEIRFQLWKDHRPALEAWLDVLPEDAVMYLRRFRLHTQFLGEEVNRSSAPSYGSQSPAYIQVNLNATEIEKTVINGESLIKERLAEPTERVLEIIKALPNVDGRPVLTKPALLRIVEEVGWFGFRDEAERKMFREVSQAKAISNSSACPIPNTIW